MTKDKDGIVHHPSNRYNCSKCMDLWIERENAKAKPKVDWRKATVEALNRAKLD